MSTLIKPLTHAEEMDRRKAMINRGVCPSCNKKLMERQFINECKRCGRQFARKV